MTLKNKSTFRKPGRPIKNVVKPINAPAKLIAKSMYIGAKAQKTGK